MNKHVLIVSACLVLGCLLVCTNVFAANEWELGTEIYYFNYEEPDFIEDTGAFYGVFARYTRHFPGWDVSASPSEYNEDEARSVMRVDGRFAFGQVDYTSIGSGTMDNVDDYVFETRLTGGYDFPMAGQSTLTPYIGLGYRYLNDDSSGRTTSTGFLGYERESNYLYLPIGADWQAPVNDLWYINVNGEFDVFLQGKQKSHLGGAVAGLNSVDNDQQNGLGVRASVRLTRDSERSTFFIEPFIRYWHIEDSDVSSITYNGVLVGYGLEPENKTFEAGAKAGVIF